MQLTDKFVRLPLSSITIKRDERQRRELFDKKGEFAQPDGLLDSIKRNGVLSPILINSDYELVFGERRYTASKVLGLPDIPVRFIEDLSEVESQILELTENLARSELPWRDEVSAVARLHGLMKGQQPSWSIEDTKRLTANGQVPEILRVARDLSSPRIADATSIRSAWNVLARMDERETADAIGDIIDAAGGVFVDDIPVDVGTTPQSNGVTAHAPIGTESARSIPMPPNASTTPLINGGIAAMPQSNSILCADFHEWAAAYSGQPFNFIHCDFPYGVNVFGGAWSGKNSWTTYNDEPDIYDQLIQTLCKHLDKLMSFSGHLMFWCSADVLIQAATIERFREWAPSLVFQTFPLIWHKTDNVGILPDPKRGPRRVYESCLVAAREDRLIVKSVSNTYGAPTDKSHHPSTKPEPMLRYFMQMFVDENTRLLDPTCGSGAALRAAESLGAKHVLGLERDPEHAKNAQHALKQFRLLRKVSK